MYIIWVERGSRGCDVSCKDEARKVSQLTRFDALGCLLQRFSFASYLFIFASFSSNHVSYSVTPPSVPPPPIHAPHSTLLRKHNHKNYLIFDATRQIHNLLTFHLPCEDMHTLYLYRRRMDQRNINGNRLAGMSTPETSVCLSSPRICRHTHKRTQIREKHCHGIRSSYNNKHASKTQIHGLAHNQKTLHARTEVGVPFFPPSPRDSPCFMPSKELRPTVPQNSARDAKHPGFFQVTKTRHFYQCVRTF